MLGYIWLISATLGPFILFYIFMVITSVAIQTQYDYNWEDFNVPDSLAMFESPTVFSKLLLGISPHDYQIKLLENKSRRIIVVWGRQLGKTFTLALYAIWFSVTRPNKRVVILAPSKKQSGIMYDEIRKIISSNRWLQQCCVKNLLSKIEWSNGSSIINHTVGKNEAKTLKGESIDLLLIDEFELLANPIETWGNVQPCTSSTHGKVIIISTPITKRGLFYAMFERAKGKKVTREYRKSIPKGKGLKWALSNKELLKDLGLRFGLPSTYGLYYIRQDTGLPQIDEQTLWEARAEFDEIKFKQEYLAMFMDEEISYWNQEEMKDSRRLKYDYVDQDFEGDQALGVDWGGTNDSTVVSVIKKEMIPRLNKEHDCLRLLNRWEFKPSDFPTGEINNKDIIKFIVNRVIPNFNITFVFTDTGAIGYEGSRQLREELSHKGITVFPISFNAIGKRKMYGRLKVLMQQGRWLMSPKDDDLVDQFMSIQYVFSERDRRQILFQVPPKCHDDIVDSVAGASCMIDFDVSSKTSATHLKKKIMGSNLVNKESFSPNRSQLVESNVSRRGRIRKPHGRKKRGGNFEDHYW